MSAAVTHQAAALVRRGRAGDQNALATIYRVGEEARRGRPRARQAFEAIKRFIESNQAQEFVLGSESPVVMDTPASSSEKIDPEAQKPALPRGAFDEILDPDVTARIIAAAWRYRHGMPGAAVALAAGPPLTEALVAEIGLKAFQDMQSKRMYLHGVNFCGEADWTRAASRLNSPNRLCMMIGQCVGRARRLQAVRQPRSSISRFSEVAGWELGERQ